MTTLAIAPAPQEIALPEVLDSDEVSRLLRVHLTTVQELARKGALPGRKVGKEYRFHKASVLAWLTNAAPQVPTRGRGRR